MMMMLQKEIEQYIETAHIILIFYKKLCKIYNKEK